MRTHFYLSIVALCLALLIPAESNAQRPRPGFGGPRMGPVGGFHPRPMIAPAPRFMPSVSFYPQVTPPFYRSYPAMYLPYNYGYWNLPTYVTPPYPTAFYNNYSFYSNYYSPLGYGYYYYRGY